MELIEGSRKKTRTKPNKTEASGGMNFRSDRKEDQEMPEQIEERKEMRDEL